MKKIFEIFQELFKDLKFNISEICLSETWFSITNVIDMNFFIKLGTGAKEEGSVFFYVNLTLIN